jgi:hypothetical protein
MKNFFLLFCSATVLFNITYCQDKPNIKPGKISAGDFTVNSPVVDSNSNAVVLADIGTCKFVGNDKGWFTVIFTEYKRVKILNKNGFPAANVNIVLYKNGDAVERIKDLKAATYNLVNGSVVATKLDDKNVFEDVLTKNYIEKKFTFPAVKEGSIIEYSYQRESDFLFHLPPWGFQGEYPCLWSSYEVRVPAVFNYTILKQGALNYYINSTDEKSETFKVKEGDNLAYRIDEIYAINTNITIKNWVMKDVPAMQIQDYTSSIENYISKLEFQLSEYRFPDRPIEKKMKDWDMVSQEMLKDEDFGRPIIEENTWVSGELKNIQNDGLSDEQKARNIFTYIRDNYTCTRQVGIFLSENMNFRTIIKKKTGSVSDLNLLLIAMLRNSSLRADPVILSTKEHGTVHPQYPMLQKFNYVICQLQINGIVYYLDVSNPYLGFGKLQPKCYNGIARVINEQPAAVNLNADELIENKSSNISLVNAISGMTGKYHMILGYNASLVLRQKVFDDKQKNYFEDEEKKYTEDVTVKSGTFDSLKNYNDPVAISYDVDIKLKNDELIYFDPMLAEQIKENPFKAQNRIYPVELPYASNTVYNLNMEIPKGYKIEELPKSQAFSLPDNKAKFQYEIAQVTDHIQLRCRLQLNKTYFDVNDYENIREFFSQIIKKENEQIVFRKIN